MDVWNDRSHYILGAGFGNYKDFSLMKSTKPTTLLPEEVEKEFDEKYVLEWLGHVDIDKDKKDHAPKEMMDFLRSYLLQSYEQGKKDALTKAIELFDKYKDEPMTGKVVILELKAMRGDYDSKEEV